MDVATLSKTLPQLPVKFDATPSSLVQNARNVISRTNNLWNDIISSIPVDGATFENTILPIIHDENARLAESRLLNFYASTSPSKDLRGASNTAQKLFNDSDVEIFSRRDMFLLVDSIATKLHLNLNPKPPQPDTSNGDEESRHYLSKLHRKFLLNGCAILDPTKKTRLEEAKKRMADLTRQCTSNLEEDQSGIWLTLEELTGVPSKFIEILEKRTGEHEGQYFVKTKPPHANKVMVYADCEATRKKVHFAIKNRLPQNVPLFRELVLVRDEVARLLGYENFLEMKTADKMVREPKVVRDLLTEIRQKICPKQAELVGELREVKAMDMKSRGEDDACGETHMFVWDENYYSRLQGDQERPTTVRVSDYFELWHTLAKLLELFGLLFETRFEQIAPEQQAQLGEGKPVVWHEDVRMFTVWDKRNGGAFLGYGYFDLFPREGKYGHKGCYAVQWGYTKPDGTRHFPACALVANFLKPKNGKPTLLSLEDTRVLFHELGHLHHTLLTSTRYAALCYVDRDFAEAPSIMFEQFLWNASILQNISQHYSYLSPEFKVIWLSESRSQSERDNPPPPPPPQLPTPDATQLTHPNYKANITRQSGNLFFALFDVTIHSPASHDVLQAMNLCETFNKLLVEIEGFRAGETTGEGWEWGHGESVFRMVVSGYEGGYYSCWRVLALQMWEREFKTDPLSKEAGRRFRDVVLQPGGSRAEMEVFLDYVGREVNTEPYFRWLGL